MTRRGFRLPTGIRGRIGLIATLLFLAGWFAFLRPVSLGGPAGYVMVTGISMEPGLHAGDLAVTQRKSVYEVGDVLAYRIPETFGSDVMVIHRVVSGSAEDGYVLRGDNTDNRDLWRPKTNDIVGKMWFRIPSGARIINSFRSPFVAAAVATLFALSLFVGATKRKKPSQPDAVADDRADVTERPAPPAITSTRPAASARKAPARGAAGSRARTSRSGRASSSGGTRKPAGAKGKGSSRTAAASKGTSRTAGRGKTGRT